MHQGGPLFRGQINLHPDDKEAEEKFKDISAANDLLNRKTGRHVCK